MCKADWSGEAAHRLAGLISNLWQQYVSPCASSRLLMLNTNRGHSIYGNLCLRGEKKLKRWDWHFNLRAPLKICFSLIHYTTANYLSRRYKLDISKKIMRCWGGSWNVLVQRAASMNRGKWSKYVGLGHTMCWMWKSGAFGATGPNAGSFPAWSFGIVTPKATLCWSYSIKMVFYLNCGYRIIGTFSVRVGAWSPSGNITKRASWRWRSPPADNKSPSCWGPHKAGKEQTSIQTLWMQLKWVSPQMSQQNRERLCMNSLRSPSLLLPRPLNVR